MNETAKIILTEDALMDIMKSDGNQTAICVVMAMCALGGYYASNVGIANLSHLSPMDVSVGLETLIDLGYVECNGAGEYEGELMYSVKNGIEVNDPNIPFR